MVMQYELSSHAAKRMQQRGIPQIVVGWLIQYGEKKRVQHGKVMVFGNQGRQRMHRQLGEAYAKWERPLKSVYIVLEDSMIVTVGHRTRRIKT